MKHTIYQGEFAGYDALTLSSVIWGVEIWRAGGDAPEEVGTLTFDASTPVEIAYDERAKYECLCGSSCTLRIISPSDRTYVGLYAIEAASVGVTIRRDGAIHWVGSLDTEFYSEPYECADGYTVTLTFTDLGVLDRLNYTAAGMRSLHDVISECASRAGLTPELAIDDSLMSLCRKAKKLMVVAGGRLGGIDSVTRRPGQSGLLSVKLGDIFVRSDNFYDDDGEPMSLQEALEGMMQPLALRMEQRAGKLWVYDLNGLYCSGVRKAVEWSADKQTLGVDEVKNDAVITWSPYAETDELLPQECWPESIEVDPTVTNLDTLDTKIVNGALVYTYHLTQDAEVWGEPDDEADEALTGAVMAYRPQINNADLTDAGFSIWLTDKGDNVEITWPQEGLKPKVFKIVPHFDGQDAEGIALRYPIVKMADRVEQIHPTWSTVIYKKVKYLEALKAGVADAALYSVADTPQPLFRTREASLPPISDGSAELRITMELLFDMRFNPFEQAIDFHSPYDQKSLETWWHANYQFLYVPVRICYKPTGGDGKVYVYCQEALTGRSAERGYRLTYADSQRGGYWTEDNLYGFYPYSYLAYYDTDDRTDRCGVFGWKTNHQRIPNYNGPLQTALAEGDDGQYIPYPPKAIQGPLGGVLWIEVLSAKWWPVCSTDTPRHLPYNKVDAQWKRVEWVLCKLPQLEIVSTSPLEREIEDEDVEYRATINPQAKEDIELSTICGTKAGGIPTARGAYFDSDGEQLTTFSRAGRIGQVEDLLIGTLYSQYATRHAKIDGEATVTADGVCAWTERCQPGKVFIMTAETQNLAQCCGDRTIVELSPDEYTKEDE